MTARVSFIGGMNVPATWGRASATVPLAELIIHDRTLKLRPRGIGRVIMNDFQVDLDQIAAAFKLRGKIMTPGVGIQLRDGLVAYFWTYTKQDAVLAALSERGVQVEPNAQRARAVWSLRSHESQASLPAMPKVLQTAAPIAGVLATAMLVALLVMAEFWWMRLVLIALWIVSMVTTLGPWWKARSGPHP